MRLRPLLYVALRAAVHHSPRRPLQHGTAAPSRRPPRPRTTTPARTPTRFSRTTRGCCSSTARAFSTAFYATQRAGSRVRRTARRSAGCSASRTCSPRSSCRRSSPRRATAAAAAARRRAPPRPRAAWVADRPEPTFRHGRSPRTRRSAARRPTRYVRSSRPRAAVAALACRCSRARLRSGRRDRGVAHAAAGDDGGGGGGGGAGSAAALRCEVLSADKDLWQLCAAPHVRVRPVDKPPRALVGRARAREARRRGGPARGPARAVWRRGRSRARRPASAPSRPRSCSRTAARSTRRCACSTAAPAARAAPPNAPLPLRKGQLAALRATRRRLARGLAALVRLARRAATVRAARLVVARSTSSGSRVLRRERRGAPPARAARRELEGEPEAAAGALSARAMSRACGLVVAPGLNDAPTGAWVIFRPSGISNRGPEQAGAVLPRQNGLKDVDHNPKTGHERRRCLSRERLNSNMYKESNQPPVRSFRAHYADTHAFTTPSFPRRRSPCLCLLRLSRRPAWPLSRSTRPASC